MLKSKYFWIAMVILVPFTIVWVMEGFGWAIATLVIMGILFLFILGGARRRRRTYYYDDYDYDDERDINININYSGDEERRRRRPPPFPPVVPINKKGVEFITGSKSLRKRQEDDLNRTLRRLRR